jgi:hypothetical protein
MRVSEGNPNMDSQDSLKMVGLVLFGLVSLLLIYKRVK